MVLVAIKRIANKRSSPHTMCAGQFVSRGFVVLLRKSNPQNHNLQTAAVRGVSQKTWSPYFVKNNLFCFSISNFYFLVWKHDFLWWEVCFSF